jgi:uncharacterized protein (TIGR02246 family)
MRLHQVLGFVLLLGACAHGGASTPAVSEESPRAGISAQHEVWRQAIIAGDSGRLASLFTPDGMILALNGTVAQGRPEVQRVFEEGAKHARYLDGRFQIQKLDVEGDLAIEIVEFSWNRSLDGGPPTGPQKGHALAVWQRQADGTWLLRAWSTKYDPKS